MRWFLNYYFFLAQGELQALNIIIIIIIILLHLITHPTKCYTISKVRAPQNKNLNWKSWYYRWMSLFDSVCEWDSSDVSEMAVRQNIIMWQW